MEMFVGQRSCMDFDGNSEDARRRGWISKRCSATWRASSYHIANFANVCSFFEAVKSKIIYLDFHIISLNQRKL